MYSDDQTLVSVVAIGVRCALAQVMLLEFMGHGATGVLCTLLTWPCDVTLSQRCRR